MARQQDPLAPVDGNSQPNPFNQQNGDDSKPVPAFAHESQQQHTLHSKLMKQGSRKQTGYYVSPSDHIMSPASAKLNAFKERRFVKTAKPRALFSKTSSMSSQEDSSSSEQAAGSKELKTEKSAKGEEMVKNEN